MKKTRQLILLILSAGLSVLFFVAGTTTASALQTKPPTSTSWYVNVSPAETDTALYNWMFNAGHDLGVRDLSLPGTQDTAVILDFGAPGLDAAGNYGASGFGKFLRVAIVRGAAKEFARGYFNGTGSDTASQLTLMVGTNNSGGQVTSIHAQAWSRLIQNIGADLTTLGYATQVSVRGAVDLEPGFSNSATAIAWADGYTSVWRSPYLLYNYGSADGCPVAGATSNPGACNNGWNQDVIRYVSWQVAPAWPIPEIYSTAGGNAKQWQQISLYSVLRYSAPIVIREPLSQSQACLQRGGCSGTNNTSDMAWSQMWNALNADTRTAQSLTWSSDIKWRQ